MAAAALHEPPIDRVGEVDPLDALAVAERVLRGAGLGEVADLLAGARLDEGKFEALVKYARGPAATARERRDAAYGRLSALLTRPHQSVNARARAVEIAVRRYEVSGWRLDRRAGSDALPATDLERRAKYDVLDAGAAPLKLTALRQLIGKQVK